MNYKVKKSKKKWNIEYYEYDLDGFSFHPNKDKTSNELKITSIKIYNEDMTKNLISNKIQDKFELLYNKIMTYLYNDDSSDDAYEIVLGEVQKFRSALEIKYRKFMKNEEYKLYIDNLYYMDIEIRNKMAMNNYRRQMDLYQMYDEEYIEELEDEPRRGRSR